MMITSHYYILFLKQSSCHFEIYIDSFDTNRKYKDYVYRKMLVQEYLKK